MTDRELDRALDRALDRQRQEDAEDRRRAARGRERAARRAVPGAPRSFVVTWLLALLLGLLGADRFYLGKTGTAVAKLLTVGGLGLWYLADLVIVLTGNQRDRWGRRLDGWLPPRVTWVVTGAVVLLAIVGSLVSDALGPRGGVF